MAKISFQRFGAITAVARVPAISAFNAVSTVNFKRRLEMAERSFYNLMSLASSFASASSFLAPVGVMEDGRRTVLGTSVSLSEAKIHWRQFLLDLKRRVIHSLKLITRDDHAGLKKAKISVFLSVP